MNKNDDGKNKGGRPPVKLEWGQFDKLCRMHCTLVEIAGWFDCSEDTIERAVVKEKGEGFADYHKKHKGKGKVSLRRVQWQMALGGKDDAGVFHRPDKTMMIWLGKQYLDQSDKHEHSGDPDNPLNFTFNGVKCIAGCEVKKDINASDKRL
jgi:hypothetical protein